MNNTQKIIGSVLISSLLAIAPVMASAETLQATDSTGITIATNGIVRVIGADVTSVSNGVVSAFTTIGNVVLNWAVTVSNSTKVNRDGSNNATTSGIKVGDKVGFTGLLSSSTGSSLNVAAKSIIDASILPFHPFRGIETGTILSINTANNSLILKVGSRMVTVQENASTTVSLNGATSSLASLAAGEHVSVNGTMSSNGSLVAATKIIVRTPKSFEKPEAGEATTSKNDEGNNEGADVQSSTSVNAHAGLGNGILNFFSGLHGGIK